MSMSDEWDTHLPDVRFSLANERTFLAWGRTSLTTIGTGLLIVKLLEDKGTLALVLGAGLIALGMLAGIGAYISYRRIDKAVRTGAPVSTTGMAVLLLIIIVFAGIFGLLLTRV